MLNALRMNTRQTEFVSPVVTTFSGITFHNQNRYNKMKENSWIIYIRFIRSYIMLMVETDKSVDIKKKQQKTKSINAIKNCSLLSKFYYGPNR